MLNHSRSIQMYCTSPSEQDHLLCDTSIILLKQFLIENIQL